MKKFRFYVDIVAKDEDTAQDIFDNRDAFEDFSVEEVELQEWETVDE